MTNTIDNNFTMKFLCQLPDEDLWKKEINNIKNSQEFLGYVSNKLGVAPYLVDEADLDLARNMIMKHEKARSIFFKSTSPSPSTVFSPFYKSPISNIASCYEGFLCLSDKLIEQIRKS